jgi:PAS domain S-box-containing protein
MDVSPRVPAKGDDGPEILWEDGERLFCREWVPSSDGKPKKVLIVRLASDSPTPASVDRLAHEYDLKDELDGAWAVRPLRLIREHGRTSLMLEDPDSEPLDRLLGTPMETGRFLRLAVAITSALMQMHGRGLIHKDVKPANILVNPAGGARFTGFGLASRLSRERQQLEPCETIAGTLAYMAPEQTGRMNRPIDSRSDLYALGVTFYQMLTGILPFSAADPIEWIHCHIARQTVPPAEQMEGVAVVLSAIVMKLLAKTAEERYQTAASLINDLQRCLTAWDSQGQIEDFPLGERDTSGQLLIPEKLYGRAREIDTLVASFEFTRNAPARVILISGYSGVGKSALVHEFHKTLPLKGSFLASGKFDQYRRHTPYATIAQAFQNIIRHLLAKSDLDLAPWRDALREALGPLGGLLVDLIPELQLIIGAQPPVPEISSQNAQRRFQLVLQRFIRVFAKAEHPMVLFLDDLQWLDAATMDLLEDILIRSDLKNLLLIGAYRHNEVSSTHPLTRNLDVIRGAGARVQEIRLTPLSHNDVDQFTADALRCEAGHAAPLAQLIHEKTGGNPFFLIQFIYALTQEALLVFDHEKAMWTWDLRGIHSKGYTENIGDLMVGKLRGLSDEERRTLLELACLGNSAGVTALALVHGTSEQQIHEDLGRAVRLNLIQRLDNSYKFAHDRIREAAYALEPAEGMAALHLRIGIILAGQSTSIDEDVYVVANQLNRGLAAVTHAGEREQIITVNLSAGQRARNAGAYGTAIIYLDVAREMLGADAHPSRDPTAFAVALLRAECEFLAGHLAVAEEQLLELSQSCATLQASSDVTKLRAQLYTSNGQIDRAVDVCLEYLRQVGINWSPHPSRDEAERERLQLRSLAEHLSNDQLHALLPMTNLDHRATMRVFADLVTPAFLTDRNLSDIMLLAAARLTVEHGVCPESCYPLTTVFGVLASNPDDAELGFRLSRFGAELAEKQPQLGLSGRALLVFGLHVTPWIRPVRSGQPFIQRGLTISLAIGDLAFAAYSHRGLMSLGLFCGDPLRELYSDAEQALVVANNSSAWLSADFLAIQKALTLCLMKRDENIHFDARGPTGFDLPEGTQPLSEFFSCVAQLQLSFLAGLHDVALTIVERAGKLSWCARAYLEFAEFRFYAGLAYAAAYDTSSAEQRDAHLSSLREQHRKLAIWSSRIAANFSARQAVLSAEIARIEGRELEAGRLYEQAIRLARETGFVQIEAIAGELAARFYKARGIDTPVLSYLANARDCYLRWGAESKVRQLDEMYPYLREREPALKATNTIGAPLEHLDLATVLKVSEAVSGEIVLETLIDTLLRAAIEHAGAERGLLILPHGSELRVRAEATTKGTSVTVELRDQPVTGAEIADSLVLYAARTHESVILEDASRQGTFASDEYIRRKNVRSVLTLPLLKQGKPVAFLYLENNLAPLVFTPARVDLLKFLASEAATSLDNARLYRALQERESRIRRLVDANIIGIHIFNEEGVIVDANHSFLKTVGYDREDLIAGQLRYIDLTPPEWRNRSASAQSEMKMTGAAQPFEKEYFRKDGSRVPVLIGSAALDEQRDQGVTFVLDLSERKRAETEARESERRYREAQLELAHANRVAVTGQLTASIAHEVNQPTTAVIASAEAALRWLDRRPPRLDAVRQALVRIVQNSIRASEVIGRVRDLIKKKPPKTDLLSINAIMGEVIELTQAEAAANRVSVRATFVEHLPEVVGDKVELQQVAVNLILNAIEAMGETTDGPRELLVRTAKTDDKNIVVAVVDTGPGLPRQAHELLFEPFYTTKQGGLGVGLSICRSIIEAHGGRLWATANEPRGAIFQFTLLASDEHEN